MYTGTQTHSTLIARLADGADADAWREFCDRYGELIRGFCVRRGLQAADVDDVRQDVLLSLSKAMPGFEYDPSKGLFRSYLKTIVVRAIFRRIRQNPSVYPLSVPEEPVTTRGGDDGDEPLWEEEWRQYHYRRAMRTIEAEFGEKDRRAFDLYAVAGREVHAVAGELSMSVDAVYQAKSRIVRRLVSIIGAQVMEEG
jgi:RNA polymerase sigma-70 factor (ECF subfamily)